MKCKEIMTHILSDAVPSWMKYHRHEKDIRTVRKVYSIGDLCYINDYDRLSSDMSKSQLENVKHYLSSSTNLTVNNSATLTSTLSKLLVRKFTHCSTSDVTKSTGDLYNNCRRQHVSINDHNMILKENIQFIERISEGQLSTVYKALYRTKQDELLTVAVKKFHQKFNYHDLSDGISVLQDIQHPHILQFFGLIIHRDHSIMFVVEYAHDKSLYDCLISTNAKCEYSIHMLLEFVKQMTSAMSYLEEKCLMHGNLSCRNCLLLDKSCVKLSDVGLNISWKDRLKSSAAWMSPEAIRSHRLTIASDVFAFGVAMWECFSYGQIPWKEMTHDEIANAIDAPNHQRLPRPSHIPSELYQIMVRCWKYESSERPTFSELDKALAEIELKQVRWINNNSTSINLPDVFLSIQSCLMGPLTILDRCLDIPSSSLSASINNLIQCVAVDGQIGFVYHSNVEPLHAIIIPEQTSSTMNNIFYRKPGIKKNSTKSKCKHISKDMISSPQADFVHAFHLGVEGETFGNITCVDNVEKANLTIELNTKQSTSTPIEQQSNEEQSGSLLDEVMQAFTEIYSETESTSLSDDNLRTRSTSPIINIQLPSINTNQFSSDALTDSNYRSPPFSRLLSKLTIKKPNETPCRFTRELEERSRNGDLSEQGKRAYNLLINRCTSNSSTSSSSAFSSSSSSNQEKSDYHSRYSSISSLYSRSSSINKNEQQLHPVTGQPLPPPPDLSTLGSKLTTATMTHTFNLPASLIPYKYPTKKRFNLFA